MTAREALLIELDSVLDETRVGHIVDLTELMAALDAYVDEKMAGGE